jgi:hypothetical protein
VASSSSPAAPVSHVDLARFPLTTDVIFATRFPRWNPRPLSTVGSAPRDSEGAGPRISPGGNPPFTGRAESAEQTNGRRSGRAQVIGAGTGEPRSVRNNEKRSATGRVGR